MGFRDLIDAFGTAKLTTLLGVTDGNVRIWKNRDSIPPEYWPRLIEVAPAHGVDSLTLEALVRMRAAARGKRGEAA